MTDFLNLLAKIISNERNKSFRRINQAKRSAVRVFFMFHPLKTLAWLSAVLGVIGMIPIARFLLFYMIGKGNGHLQSLVLGASLLILSAIVLVAGLLADLISQNRKLVERLQATLISSLPPAPLWPTARCSTQVTR